MHARHPRLTLIAALLVGLLSPRVRAQDPFAVRPPAKAKDTEAESQDAHVTQLNEFAGRKDAYLADAISQFARIKNWRDADRWLTRGVGPINDQARLAAIGNRIGADNLFRLGAELEVDAAAQDIIKKLSKAVKAANEARDRLSAAIDGLDDPSIDTRLGSARTLLSGGLAAVELLVESAVSDNPTAPRGMVLSAMRRLGGNGQQAFRQLALYGDPTIRPNAIRALAGYDLRDSAADLATAMHAADSTDTERTIADELLQKLYGGRISQDEAIRYLFSDLQDKRRLAAEIDNGVTATMVWSVGKDRKTATPQATREIHFAYRNAFDAVARLRRISRFTPTMFHEMLAADLSYRVIINPDWGSTDEIASVQNAYGGLITSTALSNSIDNAIESDDRPALVGLLRFIGGQPANWDAKELLASSGAQFAPIVMACQNSDQRVRYEASAAIARLSPPPSFAGSSHVTRCLAEMQALGEKPLAVLVETRPDVALRQEAILSKLGFQTKLVGTAVELEHLIARGGDYRLILSKTNIWDVPPVEMIDRVRRQALGKNIPILFYGDLVNQDDVTQTLQDIRESARVFKSESDEYLASLKEANSKIEVTDLLQRLTELRDENHYQEAQAKLNLILEDKKNVDTLTSQAEFAWKRAVIIAQSRIKALKLTSSEVAPYIQPREDAVKRGIKSKRWKGISRLIDRPRTPSAFSNLMTDIDLANRLPHLTSLDRQFYRQVATDYLASR